MAFATPDDIAARLGRALGANETAPVALLLEGAQGVIADAVGKDDDWAPDPVPTVLKMLCIELVVRALANPQNLDSLQEGLGAHQYSIRFRQAGLFLSDAEERIARRAVYGRSSGSGRADTIANHIGVDLFDEVFVDEDVIAS